MIKLQSSMSKHIPVSTTSIFVAIFCVSDLFLWCLVVGRFDIASRWP